MRSISLPFRGATNHTSFIRQPGDAAPLARLRNFRVRVGPGGRQQGGTRPGIVRKTSAALGIGEIQGMCKVTRRAGVSGYTLGACDPMGDVLSGGTGVLAGNLGFLDSVPSVAAFADLSVVGDGGPATTPVERLSIAPDGLHYAAGLNYLSRGYVRCSVRVLAQDLSVTWQTTISAASIDRRLAFLLLTNDYLIVGLNQGAGPTVADVIVQVYGRTDGVLLQTTTLRGWAGRLVGAARYVIGTTEHVVIAFDGSASGAPGSPGISITDGNPASMYQAGFMRFSITPRATLGAGSALVEIPQTTPLAPSDPWYDERGHQYWRLSEWTSQRPYGRWITSVSAAADGTVYLTTTSHGYGPSFVYPPNGALLPAINVFAVATDGSIVYEASTDPVIEIGMGGLYNDIPTALGELASLTCGCVNSDKVFFCAGRYAQGGYSAFGINPTGLTVWRTALMSSTTAVLAAAIDPTNGYPVFAGERHTSWPGSSGANANLWSLVPATGAVAWGWDINKSVPARSVAVGPAGDFVYGTDRF